MATPARRAKATTKATTPSRRLSLRARLGGDADGRDSVAHLSSGTAVAAEALRTGVLPGRRPKNPISLEDETMRGVTLTTTASRTNTWAKTSPEAARRRPTRTRWTRSGVPTACRTRTAARCARAARCSPGAISGGSSCDRRAGRRPDAKPRRLILRAAPGAESRAMTRDLSRALEVAIAAAREAGELLRADLHRPGGPRGEVDKAEADTEAEQLIRDAAARRLPGLGLPGRGDGARPGPRRRAALARGSERRHPRLPARAARQRRLDRAPRGCAARASASCSPSPIPTTAATSSPGPRAAGP